MSWNVIKEILKSEKEFTETTYKRLQKALVYIENNLIDSGGVLFNSRLFEINK